MKKLNFIYGSFITLFFVICSCNKTEIKQQSHVEFPAGKWKVISLKTKNQKILFNGNRNYVVELNLGNRITVNAEDNSLSGNLIDLRSDSLKLETMEMTDICCNSDTAKVLFRFFSMPSNYFQNANQLTLSSKKGILEMRK